MTKEREFSGCEIKRVSEGIFRYFLSVNHDKERGVRGRNTRHFLHFPSDVFKAKHRLH